jgi:hypothetical protein
LDRIGIVLVSIAEKVVFKKYLEKARTGKNKTGTRRKTGIRDE